MKRYSWIGFGLVGVSVALITASCGGHAFLGDSQSDSLNSDDDDEIGSKTGDEGSDSSGELPDDTTKDDDGTVVDDEPIDDDVVDDVPVDDEPPVDDVPADDTMPPDDMPPDDMPPPDPSTYEPCKDKVCGEACDACAPGLQCIIGAGFCTLEGSCLPTEPVCEEPAPTCPETCAVPDVCKFCGDGSCAKPNVHCDANGGCGEVEWICEVPPQCGIAEDCPAVGAPCELCWNGDAACPVQSCVEGQCLVKFEECPPYEPCAGKEPGAACTLCAPNDPGCTETEELKTCQEGVCRSAVLPAQ